MLKNINYNNRFFVSMAFVAGFAIPVSTFLQSLTIVFMCLVVLIAPKSRANIIQSLKVPFVSLSLALYCVFIGYSLISPAPLDDIQHMLNKMLIYGVCPLVFVYYSSSVYRRATVYGFGVGALISLATSLIMFILNKPRFFATHGGWSCTIGDWAAFHYHTDHNYFLALFVVGLISVLLYFRSILTKSKKITIFLLITLSLIDIFYLVQGRAGQIMCVEMLCLVFLLWSFRKGLLISIMILCMIPIIIHTSAAVKCGIERTANDVVQYNNGTNLDTSVGDRLAFHKYAKELIYEHPFRGYGTGSFKLVYHNLTGMTGNLDPYHPHNDFYWLWIELGILGPLILLAMTLSLLRYGFRYKTVEAKLAIILSLSYLVGSQEGGFYTDAITGGAFIVFACILLSTSTIKQES